METDKTRTDTIAIHIYTFNVFQSKKIYHLQDVSLELTDRGFQLKRLKRK